MGDINIRVQDRAGRITLTRPESLNALTYDMVRAIEASLDGWRDSGPDLIVIDAEGEKAFCAGGDIEDLYRSGIAGDFAFGRNFWRDEYRMNAKLARFPKPVISLMQGFTMGGGVGIGCHASHRIVGESSQIAMPECGIGLVPDVGGSLRLAQAPGRLGAYLGLTGARMGPGDAIHAGFADHFVPKAEWSGLIDALCESGDAGMISLHPAPDAPLAAEAAEIDNIFAGSDLNAILGRAEGMVVAKALERNSPLAMACTLRILEAVAADPQIETALRHEFRYTYRSMEHGDFLEGIRAAIIDKDRNPQWRYASSADLPKDMTRNMTASLGEERLILEDPA